MSLPSSLRARLHSISPEERRLGLLELASSSPCEVVDAHEANHILRDIAETDPNPEVRASARRILSHISSKRISEGDQAQNTSEFLSESSFNTVSPVEQLDLLLRRIRARASLSPEELPLIREITLHSDDPRLRSAAVSMLGGCGDAPDVLPACVTALADPDARVRANAVEALARLGSEEALRAVAPALTDADHRVQLNAVAALRACGGAPVFRLLRRLSLEGSVSHRRAALHVLSEYSFRAALGAIAEVARHEKVDQLRHEAKKILEDRAAADRYAAELLAGLDAGESGPPLPPSPGGVYSRPLSAADETDPLFSIEPSDRNAAIEELEYDSSGLTTERMRRAVSAERDPFRLSRLLSLTGRHRIAIPPEEIAPFLTDTDPRVRAAAVETYAMLVPWPAFHDVLARALRDPNHRVRGTAIMAFMTDPQLRVAPFLQPLATSESAAARKTVIHILATRPRAEFVPFLEWLLDDPEPEIRNLTFGILHMYETDKIPGAAQLRDRISERAQSRHRRPWVFDNAFDRVFRGLFQPDTPEFQSTQPGDPEKSSHSPQFASPDELDDVLSPVREAATLLALGEKMASVGFLPPAIAAECDRLSAPVSPLLSDPAGSEAASIGDAVTAAATAALQHLEKVSREERRRALLRRAAASLCGNRAMISPDQRRRLAPELDAATTASCEHIPPLTAALLPAPGASPADIFDFTLNLYQQNLFALMKFPFTLYLLVYIVFYIYKSFYPVMRFPPSAEMVAAIGAGGLFVYILAKAGICHTVQALVNGRHLSLFSIFSKAAGSWGDLFLVQTLKFFCLSGWALLGFFLAGLAAMPGEILSLAHLRGFFTFSGSIVFLLVFGNAFFWYFQAEPMVALGLVSGSTWEMLDKCRISAKRDWKTVVPLFFLANLLAIFIASSTEDVFLLFPFGRSALLDAIADQTAIFLLVIVYASIVVVTLMRNSPPRPAWPDSEMECR